METLTDLPDEEGHSSPPLFVFGINLILIYELSCVGTHAFRLVLKPSIHFPVASGSNDLTRNLTVSKH